MLTTFHPKRGARRRQGAAAIRGAGGLWASSDEGGHMTPLRTVKTGAIGCG